MIPSTELGNLFSSSSIKVRSLLISYSLSFNQSQLIKKVYWLIIYSKQANSWLYGVFKKCLKLKLYLPRQKWTKNYFKIIHLAFNILIPVNFLQVKVPLKILLWFTMKLCCHISFSVLHVLKSYCWDEFSV